MSDSTLGIPKAVLAIWLLLRAKLYGCLPSYGLKLFWVVEQKSVLKSPNSAHPTFSGISNRNKLRLEAFLVQKRAESSTQHSPIESPRSCEFPSVPKTSSDSQVCLKTFYPDDGVSAS